MTIFRNKSRERYTVVDNSILHNKELCLKDRGMLITLLSLPDNWEFSEKGLEAILGDGLSSIKSSLKNLEKLGYLERKQLRGSNGRLMKNEYHIHEIPVCKKCEKPLAENQLTVNPITDNHTQYITKVSNTKELSNKDNIYPIPNNPVQEKFNKWYEAYPRKVGKANAEKSFKKLNPNDELLEHMLLVLEKQIKQNGWTKQNEKFIPHPATYLNQGRWEDEIYEQVEITEVINFDTGKKDSFDELFT